MMFSLCGIMILFGFSWAFAAFTVKGASEVFQFLFVVFNSLQGFFIFLFFVVFAKEARKLWLRLCGCKKRKKYHVTSSSNMYSSVTSRNLKSKKSVTSFDSVPELDIDDKIDVEAAVHQKPTVEFISRGSNLGTVPDEQQLEEQQTQPETEDDGHSTADSGITTDRKTESTGDTSSPASIKKIQEVDTPDFVTYDEACSSEALHNVDTSTDHTDVSDHTDIAADHTDIAADHTDTAADHTDTAADHTDIAADHTDIAADHTNIATNDDLETPLPAVSMGDNTDQRGEEAITQTLDAAVDGTRHQTEELAESKPASGSPTESETVPHEDGGEAVVVVD